MQEIEAFLEWGVRAKGWSASSRAGHKSQLSILCRWYYEARGAPLTLSALTTDVCREWMMSREIAGIRPRTRYFGVSSIRAFGLWAVEHGLLAANPGAALKLPRLDEPVQKSCTEAEKVALMDAASRRLPSPMMRAQATAILSTFLHAGLRRFELVALDVPDLQFNDDERRSLLVVRKGKGRKRREIPINSALNTHMRAWLRLRFEPGSGQTLAQRLRSLPAGTPLWTGPRRDRMTDYMIGRVLEDVRIAAGLAESDNLTPHGFRHYFATELDRAGVPLKEIQVLLGHSDIETTLRYLQAHKEHLYDAVEMLSHRAPPAQMNRDNTRDVRNLPSRRRAIMRRT